MSHVGKIANNLEKIATEIRRVSYAIGHSPVFNMEETQRAIRQAEINRQIDEQTRCIMLKREGESVEQFLERIKDCPDK